MLVYALLITNLPASLLWLLFLGIIAPGCSFVVRSRAQTQQQWSEPDASASQLRRTPLALSRPQDATTLDGLLQSHDAFERVSNFDRMLSSLQQQLSSLLSTPLVPNASNAMLFAPNVTLNIEDDGDEGIRVLSTRDDLIAMSQALVAGVAAASSASPRTQLPPLVPNLLGPLWTQSPLFELLGALDSARNNDIECDMALVWMDDTPGGTHDHSSAAATVLVRWRWGVLRSPSSSSGETTANDLVLQGKSKFVLDLLQEQVLSHTIHRVLVNGVAVPARVTAETLKTIRTSVRDLQRIPIVKQWLEEAMQKTSKVEREDGEGAFFVVNATAIHSQKQLLFDKAHWIPIDYFDQEAVLLPRSKQWIRYAAAHRTASLFFESILPTLSRPKRAGRPIFAANARLLDPEGTVLLRNKDVPEFFVSLAEWRLRTFATWELDAVQVTRWDDVSVLIRVDYRTDVDPLQRSATKISTRGSDSFTISTAGEALIQQVQQQSLTVGGLDGSWLMRSIIKSFEADRVVQLPVRSLERLALSQSNKARATADPGTATAKRSIATIRTDAAALTVYRIMESLHQDFSDMFRLDAAVVPAGKYLASDVQLHGYLDNTLVSGRKTYLRSFGWITQALSQAAKSQTIRLRTDPSSRVEMKSNGNVACKTEFVLDLTPILASLPLVPDQARSLSSVNVSVESEYTLCDVTGEITIHKLVATRINGYLAPADVLARAFQLTTEKASAGEKLSWIDVLKDLLPLVKAS